MERVSWIWILNLGLSGCYCNMVNTVPNHKNCCIGLTFSQFGTWKLEVLIHSGATHPGSGIYIAWWQDGLCGVFNYKPDSELASQRSLVIIYHSFKYLSLWVLQSAHGVPHLLVSDWQFQRFMYEMCGLCESTVSPNILDKIVLLHLGLRRTQFAAYRHDHCPQENHGLDTLTLSPSGMIFPLTFLYQTHLM